jgi:hypothetical protein
MSFWNSYLYADHTMGAILSLACFSGSLEMRHQRETRPAKKPVRLK